MQRYRVPPGRSVDLEAIDANATDAFDGGKREAKQRISQLSHELNGLQEMLYADGRHKLLVVLQGMDTSGKDGTIRHVFQHVNPLGVRVVSFKTPTEREREHDFLWRVHAHVPAAGQTVLFNRSHYEDVGIARVRGLVPETVWRRRYGHIRDFERMLADEGTTIVKLFLHIDREEQGERLRSRMDDRRKRWKLRPDDIAEREHWDDYMRAYSEAISETSAEHAPWHIIPANRKWYRNLVAAEILRETLAGLDMEYPTPDLDWDALRGRLDGL